MTQRWPSDTNEDGGLNWPRIAGMTFVIAVHAAALLLLLAPVTPLKRRLPTRFRWW